MIYFIQYSSTDIPFNYTHTTSNFIINIDVPPMQTIINLLIYSRDLNYRRQRLIHIIHITGNFPGYTWLFDHMFPFHSENYKQFDNPQIQS